MIQTKNQYYLYPQDNIEIINLIFNRVVDENII